MGLFARLLDLGGNDVDEVTRLLAYGAWERRLEGGGGLSGWCLGTGRKDLAGLKGSVWRLWYAGGS